MESLVLEADAVRFLLSSPEGSAIVDTGKFRGKDHVVFLIKDSLLHGNIRKLKKLDIGLDLFTLRERKVTVVIGHIKIFGEGIYEVTFNPADRDMRKTLKLLGEGDAFLVVIMNSLGSVKGNLVKTKGNIKEHVKKVLESTEEGAWSVEEFLKARERIFEKYSIEDLQATLRRYG